MELTLVAAQSIAQLLFMMLVGMAGAKLGILDQKATATLSRIVIHIIAPAMVLSCFFVPYDSARAGGFMLALFLGVVIHLIPIALATFWITPARFSHHQIDRMTSIYGNIGFMGIPLISSMLGNDAVFYLSAIIVVFNIFIWTHGMMLMRGHMNKSELISIIKDPNIIAILIGFVIFLLRIPVPSVLSSAITTIGSSTTFLAMLIAGATVIRSDLRSYLKEGSIYLISAVRLVLVPLIVLLIEKLLGLSGMVALVAYIAAACPVASLVTMMAVENKCHPEYSSALFALTTGLSVASLPLMVLLYAIVM